MSEIVKADQAAEEIKSLHAEIEDVMRAALPKALRIGELLTGVKAGLKHGEWGQWVEQNLPFTARTATNYIKVFENRHELKSENVSDLSSAYKMLAEPKKDATPDAGQQNSDWSKLFEMDERLIPPPGMALVATQKNREGQTETLFIRPSYADGFYYVNYMFSFGLDKDGYMQGTKKPIRRDVIKRTIKHFCHLSTATLDWESEPAEAWKFNEFLYSSYEQYFQREVLGNVSKAA